MGLALHYMLEQSPCRELSEYMVLSSGESHFTSLDFREVWHTHTTVSSVLSTELSFWFDMLVMSGPENRSRLNLRVVGLKKMSFERDIKMQNSIFISRYLGWSFTTSLNHKVAIWWGFFKLSSSKCNGYYPEKPSYHYLMI